MRVLVTWTTCGGVSAHEHELDPASSDGDAVAKPAEPTATNDIVATAERSEKNRSIAYPLRAGGGLIVGR